MRTACRNWSAIRLLRQIAQTRSSGVKIGRLSIVFLLACLLTTRATIAQQETDNSGSSQSPQESATSDPLQDEDPTSVLVPKRIRTDRDHDRLMAATLFAHGRLLYQQKKLPQALASYQRAWRYNTAETTILTDIVSLALRLKRNDEAVRYAVISAERNHSDVERMRRIAALLRQQRQFPRALKIYETIDQLHPADQLDFNYISLQLELGKLYFLTNQPASSAKTLETVKEALSDPGKFGLSTQQKKQLEGEKGATYLVIAESMLLADKTKIAKAMFRESHRINPDEPLLAFRIARTLEKSQQADKALEQLDTFFAAKTSSQGIAPYHLLERLIKQQSQDDATASKRNLEKLQELHQADPKNQPLTYQLAQTQTAQKDYAEAKTLYQTLLSEKPTADAYRGLISIHVTELQDGLAEQPATEPLKWSAEQIDQWKALTSQLAAFVGSSGSLDPLRDELTQKIFNNKRFVSQLLTQLRAQLDLEVAAEPQAEKPAEEDSDTKKPAGLLSLATVAALIAVR
ncbi:MAG TPA: tetratricopeptide repeat protein, partial [Planctomycetes bacterium]|nr:tetratricopeptide repeat protein [Planctomycetota bacterium]